MIYSLSVASTHDGVRVSFAGEIDMSVSDHLYEVLHDTLDQTLGTIEVNLRGVQLLDCTGIAALLRARDDATRGGRVMYVSQPRGIVRRVLQVTDTLTVLTADAPVRSSAPAASHRRVVDEAEAR